MNMPSLTEIIGRLEKIPISSWKGVDRPGPNFFDPLKEIITTEFSPYHEGYCTGINNYLFAIFRGSGEYNVRVTAKQASSFCEWYKAERKRFNKNEDFERLKALDQKLRSYAFDKKEKKENALKEKENALKEEFCKAFRGKEPI